MRRRIIVITLVVVMALIGVGAGVVSARPDISPAVTHFAVQMTPDPLNGIDQPVISQAPWPSPSPANANSWPVMDLVNGSATLVGWVVDGRSIYGLAAGDIPGRFTFTYGGIVDTIQTGSIHGIVTLQSAQGMLYLSASGDLNTKVIANYSFAGIAALFPQPGAVGALFAAIYGDNALAGLPNDPVPGHPEIPTLSQLYGTVLPLLPKTLGAGFSGTAVIDDGTGVFGTVQGKASFKPAGNKPLLLTVSPDQHVLAISGTIAMEGSYSTRPTRQSFHVDKDKIEQFIKDLKDRKN